MCSYLCVRAYPSCDETTNDLIIAADNAMYVSLSLGKNTYTLNENFKEESIKNKKGLIRFNSNIIN